MSRTVATNIKTVGNVVVAEFGPTRRLELTPYVRWHSKPRKWYKLWRHSQYGEIIGVEYIRFYADNKLVIALNCLPSTIIEVLAPRYHQRHLALYWMGAQAYLQPYHGTYYDEFAEDTVMADYPLLEKVINSRLSLGPDARGRTPYQRSFPKLPRGIGGMFSE